jgi:hypothetical protein
MVFGEHGCTVLFSINFQKPTEEKYICGILCPQRNFKGEHLKRKV